jgi:hypothetical protein
MSTEEFVGDIPTFIIMCSYIRPSRLPRPFIVNEVRGTPNRDTNRRLQVTYVTLNKRTICWRDIVQRDKSDEYSTKEG